MKIATSASYWCDQFQSSIAETWKSTALPASSASVRALATAFGLMCGIPLLLVHGYLSTKTSEVVDSLEMASVKTLNLISEFGTGRHPQHAA